jgi:hypothetical protein
MSPRPLPLSLLQKETIVEVEKGWYIAELIGDEKRSDVVPEIEILPTRLAEWPRYETLVEVQFKAT